jgi:hypothetical protein
MASPLRPGKQSVDLAASAPAGSRIRREPPPPVKELVVRDRNEHDRRMAVIGIIAFALAIVIVIVGMASYSGWTPREYTVRV